MFSIKFYLLAGLLLIAVSKADAAHHTQRTIQALNIQRITPSELQCSGASVRGLIKRFELSRRSVRERAGRSLDQLISRCENRTEILILLTDMTGRTCDRSMLFANMQAQWKFEGITRTLANAGYEPAIAILVKCINISTKETGLTSSYWPAQSSLFLFGQKAVFPVSELLLHSDEELACAAAGVLSSVGGNEAKAALTKAVSENREPISHACVQAALANIRK